MKKSRIFPVVILLLILTAGCGFPSRAAAPRTIYFFYNNPCASCHEEEKIYEIFQETFSDGERKKWNYDLQAYNTFEPSNEAVMDRILQKIGLARKDVTLPILIAGSKVISGYDAIRSEIRDVMSDTSWQSMALENSASLEGPEKEADFLLSFRKRLENLNQAAPEQAVLIVTTACTDCEEAEKMLGKAKVPFIAWNVTDPEVYAGYQLLMQKREIDERNWKVPCLFYGNDLYLGASEIQAAIADGSITANGSVKTTAFLLSDLSAASASENKALSSPKWYQLLGEGVVVGLNPCSLSMLLMVLSVLASSGKKAGRTGFLFLVGKAAAYFGIGLAVFRAYGFLTSGALGETRQILRMALAAVFGVLAILYLLDAYHAYRMEFGKIRMQLPASRDPKNRQSLRSNALSGGAASRHSHFCRGVLLCGPAICCLHHQYGGDTEHSPE